jgi:hypothetical protein
VSNGGSANFTVLEVLATEGSVITPGAIGSSTLFTLTGARDYVVIRLLGTVRVQGSTPMWRTLAGIGTAACVLTLSATGTGDPVLRTTTFAVGLNGNPVGPVALTEETWVDDTATFACSASVTGASVGSASTGNAANLTLILEQFVIEVVERSVTYAGESDVAVFVSDP